jgi:hypothetical protein
VYAAKAYGGIAVYLHLSLNYGGERSTSAQYSGPFSTQPTVHKEHTHAVLQTPNKHNTVNPSQLRGYSVN